MFCSQCGNQMPDGSAFCPACGKQVGVAQTIQNQATSGMPNSHVAPTQMNVEAQRYAPSQYGSTGTRQPSQRARQYPVASASTSGNDYSKLGGWLLLFTVLWAIGGVYNIYNGISSWVATSSYMGMLGGIGAVLVVLYLVYLVAGAACLALAYLIYKRNPVFLRFYQLYSIAMIALYIILMVVLLIIANAAGVGAYASAYIGGFVGGIIGAAVGVALLTMYFCKSERVRVYMGGTEYLNRAIFRIGA